MLLTSEHVVFRSHDGMIGWRNEKSFSSKPSSSCYKCILSNVPVERIFAIPSRPKSPFQLKIKMLKNLRFTWKCQQHFAFDSNNIDNNFIHKWSFQTVSNLISDYFESHFILYHGIDFLSNCLIVNGIIFTLIWFESGMILNISIRLKILLKCHVHVDMAKLARRNQRKRLYWDISLLTLHSTPWTVRSSESTQATLLDFF